MGVPGQSHPGSSARRFQGAGDRERIILMQRRRDLVSFRGASLRGTRRAHLGARTDRAGRHPRDGRRLRVRCTRHDRGHAGAVPYIPPARSGRRPTERRGAPGTTVGTPEPCPTYHTRRREHRWGASLRARGARRTWERVPGARPSGARTDRAGVPWPSHLFASPAIVTRM